MSNQIRLKRASGSDPGASDLVLGEPAVRTDTGEIFLKKDDGSIAKVAGGIDDGDKGDITVSNDGGTFTIDSGVINNAKIASNASMSLSKLEVITSNRIVGNDSGNAVPKELTAAEVRTIINVENGATADQSASEIVALIADQTIAPSTIDMEDNESILLGTGDDLTIKHNGTNAIFQNTSGDVKFFTTGTLRLRGDDIILSDKDQVESYIVCTKNSDVELYFNNSKKLNTSNTGIDVIGNIVVSGTVDGRDLATDGSKLDGIASGATNVTNTNQLTNGAGFITATLTNEQVQDIVGGMVTGNTESGIAVTYQDGDGTLDFVVGTLNQNTTGSSASCTGNAATATQLANARTIAGVSFNGTANISLNNNAITNGAGYITSADGGNAATLDSLDSTAFLRSDTGDTASGDITFSGGAGAATIAANSDIRFTTGSWTGNAYGKIQHHANRLYLGGGSDTEHSFVFRYDGSDRIYMVSNGTFYPSTDSFSDLGKTSLRWKTVYTDEIDSAEIRVNNGILETKAAIATSHTLATDFNAMSVSPTVNSGVTVTVPSGAVWAIV